MDRALNAALFDMASLLLSPSEQLEGELPSTREQVLKSFKLLQTLDGPTRRSLPLQKVQAPAPLPHLAQPTPAVKTRPLPTKKAPSANRDESLVQALLDYQKKRMTQKSSGRAPSSAIIAPSGSFRAARIPEVNTQPKSSPLRSASVGVFNTILKAKPSP